jgi:hypothetical protein
VGDPAISHSVQRLQVKLVVCLEWYEPHRGSLHRLGDGFRVLVIIFVDAVGTVITDRPPHRSVRARLRIRLPPWMSGGEALLGIGMEDAGFWNPAIKQRSKPLP